MRLFRAGTRGGERGEGEEERETLEIWGIAEEMTERSEGDSGYRSRALENGERGGPSPTAIPAAPNQRPLAPLVVYGNRIPPL